MAKEIGVVLVSPAGNEHHVTHPATEHNLRARGYKDKPARKTREARPAARTEAPAEVPEKTTEAPAE